jgi:hypothetical protein
MKPAFCLLVATSLTACANEPATVETTAAVTATITICHRGGHTIGVSQKAWKAHQSHGDTLGPCGTGCVATPGAQTLVDFRADQGVVTDSSGRVIQWEDQSGNALDAGSTFGPVSALDLAGRSVLRFSSDGGTLVAPAQLPAAGTVFLVFGGRDGADASNVVVGWGSSAVGDHGMDILTLPGFGVDAVFRNNSEIGDLLIAPNATTMEVETVSWGPAGLLFERRLADGTTLSCAPGGSGCLSNTSLTALSDGGFALHVGSSGDGGASFDGDLAQLIVNDHQLSNCERQATVDQLAQRWLVAEPPPPPPPVVFVPFATNVHPGAIAIGDLNSDGKSDVAITSATTDVVSIFINTTPVSATTPSFAPRVDVATPQVPIRAAFADFNGDGNLDLSVANNNSASVFLSTTAPGAVTPTFAARVDLPVTGNPTSILLGDVNADGKPDLVIPTTFNTIAVTLNTTATGAASASFGIETTFATDDQPGAALGDLDGDGKLDVALTSTLSGTVSVLLNTSAPGTAAPTFGSRFDVVAPGAGVVALSDINGEGTLDLVVTTAAGLTIFLNSTAVGAPTPTLSVPTSFAALPGATVIGDFDSDGLGDVATLDGPYTVAVFRNATSYGATTPSMAVPISYAIGVWANDLATGDFNGDGTLDLVVTHQDATTFSVALLP